MRLTRGRRRYSQSRTPPEAVGASGGGGVRDLAIRAKKTACTGLPCEGSQDNPPRLGGVAGLICVPMGDACAARSSPRDTSQGPVR